MRAILKMPKGPLRSTEEIEAEVRERIAELSLAMHMENQCMAEQQEELLRRATTDALTRVGNRAAFDARMALESERAIRSGEPLALMMIDVDKFKRLNDTHGHQAGDVVLQNIARTLDGTLRKVDFLARYGGEEFAVIAPNTWPGPAAQLAERLRQAVERIAIPWEGKTLRATVSVGLAMALDSAGASDVANLIKSADEQLYAAKAGGRNQVCMAGKRLAETFSFRRA
jgi:diguanylate cyclase (GGDEF)-like protein